MHSQLRPRGATGRRLEQRHHVHARSCRPRRMPAAFLGRSAGAFASQRIFSRSGCRWAAEGVKHRNPEVRALGHWGLPDHARYTGRPHGPL